MLLDEIKSRTSRLHEQVEATLDIMNDSFTLDAYRKLLGKFFGYIRPWEERVLAGLGAERAIFRGREKTFRLRSDLRFLGLGDEEIANLPVCEELPELDSVPRALGSMYVFEGATLGGQFISSHLEKRFGEMATCGFFNSYGADVGRKWKEFREILLEHSSPHADPLIIGAAVETFERFHGWLEGRPA